MTHIIVHASAAQTKTHATQGVHAFIYIWGQTNRHSWWKLNGRPPPCHRWQPNGIAKYSACALEVITHTPFNNSHRTNEFHYCARRCGLQMHQHPAHAAISANTNRPARLSAVALLVPTWNGTQGCFLSRQLCLGLTCQPPTTFRLQSKHLLFKIVKKLLLAMSDIFNFYFWLQNKILDYYFVTHHIFRWSN